MGLQKSPNSLSSTDLPIGNVVFRNVALWNPDCVQSGMDVHVDQGQVKAIGPRLRVGDALEIDATGTTLMPSGVDLQVHLRVPGQSEKETAETGLSAAMRGGYGAILNMPNTRPILDSVEALLQGRSESASFEKSTGVALLWSAAVTVGQQGERLVDFESLSNAGIVAFTDDGVGVRTPQQMAEAFRRLATLNRPLLQHAETPGHGGVLAPSRVQEKLGVKAYDESAETTMVARDLEVLATVPAARYHVLHVSAARTVELVQEAKARGLKASCEVTPHHLYFCGDDIRPGDTSFKMNPPIRSTQDRERLQAALAAGEIDFVSTDHAPHEFSKKGDDFTRSAFGTLGLETSLRVLLSLYRSGRLSPTRVVQIFSAAPAEFIGISNEFGYLAVGRPFRATWVDTEAAPTAVSESDLFSLSRNSCFLGAELPGRILGIGTRSGFFRF